MSADIRHDSAHGLFEKNKSRHTPFTVDPLEKKWSNRKPELHPVANTTESKFRSRAMLVINKDESVYFSIVRETTYALISA